MDGVLFSHAPLVTPVIDGPHGADDELDHLFHCDPDRALCGADISEVEEGEAEEPGELCVVCRELQYRDCERCGK